MRHLALALLALAAAAAPAQTLMFAPELTVKAVCSEGKMIALVVEVPGPGEVVFPLPLPPDPCTQQAPKPTSPAAPPSKPGGREASRRTARAGGRHCLLLRVRRDRPIVSPRWRLCPSV